MTRRAIPPAALAAAVSVSVSAVLSTASAVRAETPVSYAKDIAPVFQKHCLGCHSDAVQKGGLNMERREVILKGGTKRGPGLVPGDPSKSPIVTLSDADGKPKMPPKGKGLSAEEIALLKRWVAEGAKFDGEAATAPAEKPTFITIPEAVAAVYAAALSPDGKRVAFGRGSSLEVWDVDAAKRLALLTGPRDLVQSVAFSPDGKLLAAGEYEQLWLWSAEDWKPSALVPGGAMGGFADRVTAVTFTPDSKTLVAASGLPARGGLVHVIALDGVAKETRRIEAHSDCIYGLSLSADGKLVATASADKLAKLHELSTGKLVRQFSGHTHHVLGVGLSLDGKTLATGGADNDIKLWSVESGEKTKDVKGHGKHVGALAWRPDGKGFATASGDKTVRTWKPDGGQEKSYTGFADHVFAVGFSGDSARLVAAGQDGTVRVYATADGKVVREITRATPAEPPAPAAPAPAEQPKKSDKPKEKPAAEKPKDAPKPAAPEKPKDAPKPAAPEKPKDAPKPADPKDAKDPKKDEKKPAEKKPDEKK
jgi:hypothetical protein